MTNNDKAQLQGLGLFLENQKKNVKTWRMVMFVGLAVLVVLNFCLKNHHPHFSWDAIPGMWAVFGLGVGVVMIFVAKKIIQPLIKRREDFYGDL